MAVPIGESVGTVGMAPRGVGAGAGILGGDRLGVRHTLPVGDGRMCIPVLTAIPLPEAGARVIVAPPVVIRPEIAPVGGHGRVTVIVPTEATLIDPMVVAILIVRAMAEIVIVPVRQGRIPIGLIA